MTHADALKRLAQCRKNQPDYLQVTVASEIVDALLGHATAQTVMASVACTAADETYAR